MQAEPQLIDLTTMFMARATNAKVEQAEQTLREEPAEPATQDHASARREWLRAEVAMQSRLLPPVPLRAATAGGHGRR